MASGMFEKGIQSIMGGNVDLVNDSISAVLVTAAYSPAFASDEFQSIILEASFIDEARITGRSVVGGAFDGDPVTFTRAEADMVAAAVVVILDTGDGASSRLLSYHQFTPFTTDGTNIVLTWHADGIFEL